MKSRSLCSVEDCGTPATCRGFCSKHYQKMKKYGDPLRTVKPTPDGEVIKFFENVVLTYEGEECLFWLYSRYENGYAQMKANGKTAIVSRRVCEEINGPPPTDEHVAAHECGKGHLGCVSPRHLNWKTRVENEEDKLLHGTAPRGERCGAAKITEEQAREILSLRGVEKQNAIARRFGISRQAIYKIHNGKNWFWLSSNGEKSHAV